MEGGNDQITPAAPDCTDEFSQRMTGQVFFPEDGKGRLGIELLDLVRKLLVLKRDQQNRADGGGGKMSRKLGKPDLHGSVKW